MNDLNGVRAEQSEPALSPEWQAYLKDKSVRREIRQRANRTGVAFLLYFALFLLIQAILSTVTTFYVLQGGEKLSRYLSVMQNGRFSLLINSFAQAITMVLPFFTAVLLSRQKTAEIVPYGKPKAGTPFGLILIGLSCAMLSDFGCSLLNEVLARFRMTPVGGQVDFGNGLGDYAVSMITVALIPALFEEFAYRGVVFGLLEQKVGQGAAVFLSALMFGLMHGNFVQIPFAFMLGLALGYVRAYSGTMWVSMAIHFANNAFSCTVQYLSGPLGSTAANLIYLAMAVVLIGLGLYFTVTLSAKDRELFHLSGSKNGLSDRENIGLVLKSPIFLIAVIIFVIQAFATQFSLT